MIPQEYVKARSVLLDALDGLGPHRDAMILVGAQAVYAHAGDADFATAPTTTDADLALVPGRLADEPAVVDAMRAARSFEIKVAGPAALIVSKVVKIAERREQPHRLRPKDGLDVLRLLRAIDTTRLARRLAEPATDELSSTVVGQAVKELRTLAITPDDLLPVLAAEAEAGFGDPAEIKMSTVVLVEDLLREFDRGKPNDRRPVSGW